jgi:hypothetical protein
LEIHMRTAVKASTSLLAEKLLPAVGLIQAMAELT